MEVHGGQLTSSRLSRLNRNSLNHNSTVTNSKLPHRHPETLAAQALGREDPRTGAVVQPINVSTTFAREPDYSLPDNRSYLRDQGPTQELVEQMICALEGGVDALSFSSGLAACPAPFLSLNHGDHVVVSDTIYHGVMSWLEEFAEDRGLHFSLFRAGDIDDFEQKIIAGQSRLVWLETPANPSWEITDIQAIANIAHKHDMLVAVDSTCATPVLTRPIEHGADIVCHSATKFLNGHSDVLAGMLVSAIDNSLWQRIRQHRLLAGSTLGSLDAFLLQRGIRTLYVRVQRQCENAMAVAQFLQQHDRIEKVFYPGLPGNPGHEVAAKQMQDGFGGMLSVLVKGGKEEAIAMLGRARVFKRATSLGGVESLLEHRRSSEPETSKTPDNLVRISVGIEHIDDLLGDLEAMLEG